jgi:hypothetical protein
MRAPELWSSSQARALPLGVPEGAGLVGPGSQTPPIWSKALASPLLASGVSPQHWARPFAAQIRVTAAFVGVGPPGQVSASGPDTLLLSPGPRCGAPSVHPPQMAALQSWL